MLRALLILGLAAVWNGPLNAFASPKDRIACLKTESVELFLLDKNLTNLIEAAVAPCDAGAKVRVKSAQIVGDDLVSGTPIEIIDELARTHQFLWQFDGYELTAHSIKNIDTKLVAANGFTAETLHTRLAELGWVASDNSIHDTRDGAILRLSGSADFIAFLQSVLTMNDKASSQSGVAVYRNGRLAVTKPFGS